MSNLSAAREVLRCRLCSDVVLVLTLESPSTAKSCIDLLDTLIDAFKMRALVQCQACILRQQINEAPE